MQRKQIIKRRKTTYEALQKFYQKPQLDYIEVASSNNHTDSLNMPNLFDNFNRQKSIYSGHEAIIHEVRKRMLNELKDKQKKAIQRSKSVDLPAITKIIEEDY